MQISRSSKTAGPGRGNRHLTEQLLQRGFHIFFPQDPRPQLQPKPRPPRMRPHRLEPDPRQEPRRNNTVMLTFRPRLRLRITERLDGPHPTPREILRHLLHQRPADTATAELWLHVKRGQQHCVRTCRRRRKRAGSWHDSRRSIQNKPDGQLVAVQQPATRPPLEQDAGHPRFLLELGLAELLDLAAEVGSDLPVHALPTMPGKVFQVVERDAYDLPRHVTSQYGVRPPRKERTDSGQIARMAQRHRG